MPDFAYAYQDHSGSIGPGQSKYETSVQFPASVFANFLYDDSNSVFTNTAVCFYQPTNREGDWYAIPGYDTQGGHDIRIRNGTSGTVTYVQFWDDQRGWLNLALLYYFLGAYRPSSNLSFQGTHKASLSYRPGELHISNPMRFRINFPGQIDPWYWPAWGWTGLNVGWTDTCRIVTTSSAIVGYGDGVRSWTTVGSPTVQAFHPALPNDAPLAGRNRVQIIS